MWTRQQWRWSNSGYILYVGPTGFAEKLNTECERKRSGLQCLSLSNYKAELPFAER